MGQSQLLLLVLAIVIVGVAIAVGINAYSENSVKTNWDTLFQEALRVANDAQSWKQKPELFGGSPDDNKATANNFEGISFLTLGYSPDNINATGDCYRSLNGIFQIASETPLRIIGVNPSNQNEVTIEVVGNMGGDILTGADVTAGSQIRGGLDITATAPTAATITDLTGTCGAFGVGGGGTP